MASSNPWLTTISQTVTPVKKYLSRLSLLVRQDQLRFFQTTLNLGKTKKILDVGVTSEEIFPDSNYFEKNYPYPNQITIATIENVRRLTTIYPKQKIVKITPGSRLPFKNNQFDFVTSWATLEHVGDYNSQRQFLQELFRVGIKIFVTTPYRGCIYEPHSGLFFFHWLPLSWFRWICKLTRNSFWADPQHLNPLWVSDIRRLAKGQPIKIHVYKLFGLIPSHLLIYN